MIVLLLLCVVGAQAQNATGDLTMPARLGWVPSSPGRSTMDIIWSCFSVLLICSYKCIHLNIPSFKEKRAKWHKLCGVPVWPERPLVRKAYRKIYLMATILIATELGVGMAVDQYLIAKEALSEAREAVPELELTLTHGFYSAMGGFGCTAAPTSKSEVSQTLSRVSLSGESTVFLTPDQQGEEPPSSLHQRSNEESDVEDVAEAEDDGLSARRMLYVSFDTSKIRSISLASYAKICRTLPSDSDLIVSEENLNDRSKSDFVTKAFAILQSTWLIVQSINRVAHGLPLTELELATIAYILCAIVMYALWWSKPFDAEHIVVVPMSNRAKDLGIISEPWQRVADITAEIMDDEMGMGYDTTKSIKHVLFYGTATAFSAIHLAAWYWEFSSTPVKIMWRVFATVATASGVGLMAQSVLIHYSICKSDDVVMITPSVIFVIAYFISRIGIIVLVFYSFKSMPPAVYDTVDLWPTYFPHFS